MDLSIITICLNEERNLPRCLRAVQDLDHAGLTVELLVVDGGSADRSQEIARQHGAKVISSPRGIPRQRNCGAREAGGDLIAFVDADVELLPGWFETVARVFSAGPRRVLGSPPRLPPDASWIAKTYAMHWGMAEGEAMVGSDDGRLLSTQSLVLGRGVFEEVGGFPEDKRVGEDTALVRSAIERGITAHCEGQLAYYHHGEPKSLDEFFKRLLWGADRESFLEAIRRREHHRIWKSQYMYGSIVAAEVACLGASLALPVGGWQIGLPLALGTLGLTFFLPALRTACQRDALDKLGELFLMYGAFGLAMGAGMMGLGDTIRRWR
jgi:glycosyltransferase involved in cell wall biosynthesis